jgi:alpha-L-fucosidase
VDIVSKNGNLLLNVGPKADGTISPEDTAILTHIGQWLSKNGEAIYGTRPYTVAGEGVTIGTNEDYNAERLKAQMKDGLAMESGQYHLTGDDVRYTQTDEALYVIGFGIPENNTLRLRALRDGSELGAVRSARMLGTDAKVAFERSGEYMTLHLPEDRPFAEGFVIRLDKE